LHKGAEVLPHQLESHVGADAHIGPLKRAQYWRADEGIGPYKILIGLQ